MGKLQGKIAVITGGTTGIGLASAKRFVAEGAFVYIFGRRKDALDAAVAELGQNARGVQGDISKLEDLDRLFEAVKAEKGSIDVLFANAGLGNLAPLGAITPEAFDQVFDVNVKGTLFTVQKAVPLLKSGSSIILTGIDDRRDGHAGFQRLQRVEGGDPQLRPELGAGPPGHRHPDQRPRSRSDRNRSADRRLRADWHGRCDHRRADPGHADRPPG